MVDTSALIAMTLNEPEAGAFSRILDRERGVLSVANLLEAHMVMMRHRPADVSLIDGMVDDFDLTMQLVDAAQVQIARAAFDRFGKGMGHAAQLTYGDCFAYALAKLLGAPLLYKGDDFSRTDVKKAVY